MQALLRNPLAEPDIGFSDRQAAAIENAVMAEMAQYSKKDVSGMGDYHVYGNLGLAYLRLGRRCSETGGGVGGDRRQGVRMSAKIRS